jgi:hypothetical protein
MKFIDMTVMQKITLFEKAILIFVIYLILEFINKKYQEITMMRKTIIFLMACLLSAMIIGYLMFN